MSKIMRAARLIAVICLGPCFCRGQGAPPVSWHFAAQPVNGNETRLTLTATLAPGWHIYSQHMKGGGPIPTRFHFDTGDDMVLQATTFEKGKAHTFYDTLYEMEITWYSDQVLFQQNVTLINPVNAIRGTVEYMTCNDATCIPDHLEFSIPLKP